MIASDTETVQRTGQNTISLSVFQRIVEGDQTVVPECVQKYGDFIWALATHFTHSTEEAEAATREIFIDIWKYAENDFNSRTADNLIISLIARRRLIRYLQSQDL